MLQSFFIRYIFSENLYYYYGGHKQATPTQIMVKMYRKMIEHPYTTRLFIDIHTGYGPKNQMNIVNDYLEMRSSEDLAGAFNYPFVQNANGDDFYQTHGDMTHYLARQLGENDYATCFEFGMMGVRL